MEELTLDADTALSCGLILNELVSNAFKHAFNGRAKGLISVLLRQEGEGILLSVRDDGLGMSEDLELATAKSLGLRIVAMKARELGGTVVVERGRGTKFSMVFKPRK